MPGTKGKLILIPTPLGDDESSLATIPEWNKQQIAPIRLFIAERTRTARRWLKKMVPEMDISSLTFAEINEHSGDTDWKNLLKEANVGQDIGLLSEAGCPGIADPGAEVVQKAHEMEISVVPLVGPSSLLLALMASGLNGQNFSFCGYLPVRMPELGKELRRLEQEAIRFRKAQLFIETPYRNQTLFKSCLDILSPDTKLCIAMDVATQDAFIYTTTIKKWKTLPTPDLHKKPTVFIIGS